MGNYSPINFFKLTSLNLFKLKALYFPINFISLL
nr:MAG TPA: hypothetical protein [Caudoviricetes sp.]